MADPRIIALLEARAKLLAPPPELIERAIQRCVRQDLRRKLDRSSADRGTASSTRTAISRTPAPGSGSRAGSESRDGAVATVLSVPGMPTPSRPGETGEGSGGRDADLALQPGQIIAGYRIDALLGKGGMGQVFKATQLSMGRHVALKILAPRLAANPRFRERFLREARNAGRLHHPNLIAVHDVGEAGGLMYFSMDLVEGRSLKDLLRDDGPVEPAVAARWMRQVLAGLGYAHAKGVVHRDIKPDNLMLTNEGQIRIADLGLSRDDAGEGDLFTTQEGTAMGTPHYMAPEQGRDAHTVDLRADLYGVGATWFHLIYDRPPFEGPTPMAVVLAANTQSVPFPEQPASALPFRPLLTRLLARNPADRPADAAAADVMLAAALRGELLDASPPPPVLIPAAPPAVSAPAPISVLRPWRWLGVLLLLIMSAALLAILAVTIQAQAAQARTQRRIEALRHELETLWTSGGFAEAQRVLDAARAEAPPGSPLEPVVEDLQRETAHRLDEQAMRLAQPILNEAAAHLGAGNLKDASEALARIPVAGSSPAVAQAVAAIQRELVDAYEDRRGKGGPRQPMLEKMREEFVRRLEVTPAESLRLEGLHWDLLGRGWCRLAPLFDFRKSVPIRLKLKGDAQVTIELATGISLRVTRKTLHLADGATVRDLPRPSANEDGQLQVILDTDGATTALRLGDQVLLRSANASPRLSWVVPAETRAEVDLKPRPGR